MTELAEVGAKWSTGGEKVGRRNFRVCCGCWEGIV